MNSLDKLLNKKVCRGERCRNSRKASPTNWDVALLQESPSVDSETSTLLARFEAATMIRRLATQEHSAVLIMKFGAGTGDDTIVKMNGLILDLFNRLQAETLSGTGDNDFARVKCSTREWIRHEGDLEADTAKHSSILGKEQTLDVLVLEMVKQSVEVPKTISQDRIQQRTVEQIVDIPVPQVGEELVEVSKVLLQDRIQQRFVEQTIETPPISLAEKIVEVSAFRRKERRNRL